MVDMLFMQKQQNNSLNFMYTYDDMHDNFFTTHIFNSKKYLTKYTWNINETEKNLKLQILLERYAYSEISGTSILI